MIYQGENKFPPVTAGREFVERPVMRRRLFLGISAIAAGFLTLALFAGTKTHVLQDSSNFAEAVISERIGGGTGTGGSKLKKLGGLPSKKAAQIGVEKSSYVGSLSAATAPDTSRFPENYQKYTVDLFSHPKVIEAFNRDDISTVDMEEVRSVCFGPANNIDVFINEDATLYNELGSDGFNIFNLDCRDKEANPLIAFIVVIDMAGNVINVHNPDIRAESVVMKDSSTVLFSLVGRDHGTWLWNFRDDTLERLPFDLDAHTAIYVPYMNPYFGDSFFGCVVAKKFNPSEVNGFSADGSELLWDYVQPESHINSLSIDGRYMYMSLSSLGSIKKLDMGTRETVFTIGGPESTVNVVDIEGNVYATMGGEGYVTSWSHQNRFMHVDDKYYTMFDNHVADGPTKSFIDDKNSRMVVLQHDVAANTAYEVFAWDTGDKAYIYGTTVMLPTGNLLGNSYPDVVHPSVEDRQYQVNLWEVRPDGEIAMRVGIKGNNPFDPEGDAQASHYHSTGPNEEPPTGWTIYNVERFYSKPVVLDPCLETVDGAPAIRLVVFNTVRTESDMAGGVYLYDPNTLEMVDEKTFTYHRTWLPRTVTVQIPDALSGTVVTMAVVNEWEDANVMSLDHSTLPQCEPVESKWPFTSAEGSASV